MSQTIIVAVIGVVLAVVIVVRIIRTFRRPKCTCGGCPLANNCQSRRPNNGCCK